MVFGEQSVELLDLFDHQALRALAYPFRVADVMDGIAAGLKQHSLEPARQKSGGPLSSGHGLHPAATAL